MENALHKRGHAMEEAFFSKKDAELLEKLRQKRFEEVTREEISAATGIRDEQVLDRLMELEIDVQTLAALSVIPLVEVAWADGKMDNKERKAILQAADEAGIPKDGPGYHLLQNWLQEDPPDVILSVWKDYIAALADTLDKESYAQVRDNLLDRAQQVAESAGGILGLGKISPEEQKILDAMRAAFKK